MFTSFETFKAFRSEVVYWSCSCGQLKLNFHELLYIYVIRFECNPFGENNL